MSTLILSPSDFYFPQQPKFEEDDESIITKYTPKGFELKPNWRSHFVQNFLSAGINDEYDYANCSSVVFEKQKFKLAEDQLAPSLKGRQIEQTNTNPKPLEKTSLSGPNALDKERVETKPLKKEGSVLNFILAILSSLSWVFCR